MEYLLYGFGGFLLLVALAQAFFGEEAVQNFARGMRKAGCAMTIFISVPIVITFLFPPVGIPLLILGVLAAIGKAVRAGKEEPDEEE